MSAGKYVSRRKRPVPWKLLTVLVLVTLSCLLTSGYMLAVGNKDSFCVSCHVMEPFRDSWQASVHGGNNTGGVVVQCVQCHLPHDGIFRFTMGKARQGLHELVSNFSIDGKRFDWSGNADRRRKLFTHDSACLACHARLFPAQLSEHGRQAHHRYTDEPARHRCIDCHPKVGHHRPMAAAENFFRGQPATVRRLAGDD